MPPAGSAADGVSSRPMDIASGDQAWAVPWPAYEPRPGVARDAAEDALRAVPDAQPDLSQHRHVAPSADGSELRLAAARAVPAHRAGRGAGQARHGLLRGLQLHLRPLPELAGHGPALRHPDAHARSRAPPVLDGRGHHPHRAGHHLLGEPAAPVLRGPPLRHPRPPDPRPGGLEHRHLRQPPRDDPRSARAGGPRCPLRARRRVRRRLLSTVGELGGRRPGDGSRGGHLRRPGEDPPPRPRRPLLPLARARCTSRPRRSAAP